VSASDWATIASLATALGTMLPLSMHPDAAPADGSARDADAKVDSGWFASQSRHWNIDRPDPR
jgi:hypothetical protein